MANRLTMPQLRELGLIDMAGEGIAQAVRCLVDGYYPQGEGPIWAWPREDAKRYKRMKSCEYTELIRIDRAFDDVGTRVQELIARLTSGGVVLKTDDPRIIQAKVLWDKGLGQKVIIGFDPNMPGIDGFGEYNVSVPGTPVAAKNFAEYLATIPEPPPRPPIEYLNKLILVDRRVYLVDACRMADLWYAGHNKSSVPFDPNATKQFGDVYWIWCQDGRRNRDKAPSTCLREFAVGEVGLDDFEFVALYLQDPTVIGTKEDPHYLHLLGSMHKENNFDIVCGGIGPISGPALGCGWDWAPSKMCGAASRWNG